MDIYSKRVPRTRAGPSSSAGAGPSGYDNQGYHQHSPYDHQEYHQQSPYDNQGYHQEYHSPGNDNQGYHNSPENTEELPLPPRQTPIIPRFPTMPESGPVPVNRNDVDVDVDAIDAVPEREMETGDEYQGVWEDDDLSDGDANVAGLSRAEKFPIRGRGNKHPVATFNDTTAFEEADISFFGPRVVYNKELAAGQVYTSVDELVKKIYETHVHGNWECIIHKRDRTRLVVLCSTHPHCEFRLFATPAGSGEAWMIKKCEPPHTCKSASTRTDHSNLTASLIADAIEEDIKLDPSMSIKAVAMTVRHKYKYVIPKYNRLWRGRELAICRIFGSWKDSYGYLAPLLQAMASTNVGTVYERWHGPFFDKDGVLIEGAKQFKGIAWAFGPYIQAVPYIRPVISIDACFMSGRYEGRLLIACAYDAENQLLPLAFAIVRKEDGENWGFFMQFLRRRVIGEGKFFCVISDQHKGIKYVFDREDYGWSTRTGQCVHRLCMQHVAENLSKATGGDTWVTDTFRWNCRKKKPRRVVEMTSSFARYMPKANLYLMKVGKNNPRDVNEDPAYEKIYQSRDGGWRWGIMTTNGSESLNAVFKQSRMLPVAAVVEDTFYKLNAWFQERRAKAAELIRMNQSFSTRVEEKLRRHRDKGATMTVIPMGNDGTEFEVQNPNEYVPTTRKPDGTMAFVKRACKYVVKFRDARAGY
ncbi:uncharacterized protein LOC144561871 [Carex rostrata]